jgi:hypothetical protein
LSSFQRASLYPHPPQNVVHEPGDGWARLHAVQALARVVQLVARVLRQQIVVGRVPQLKHALRDLHCEGEMT